MRRMRCAGAWLALLLIGCSVAGAQSDEPLLMGVSVDASAFRITRFAEHLSFPNGLVHLPDGSLLVAESVPTGGSYFESTGRLVRFVDIDGDGIADDDGTTIADDLSGTIVALERADALLFVTSAASGREGITVLRRGTTWSDPVSVAGEISFPFSNFDHQSYGLAIRKHAGVRHAYDLFFNIGAYRNDDAGSTVEATGLFSATLNDASIYMETFVDDGVTLVFHDPVQIATGLRNAATFTFEPGSGDLLIADNGIDTPENRIVALSADEIDRIPADQIGGEIEDFGFPETYTTYSDGSLVGSRGHPPVIAFRPIDGSENEGASSIAYAPKSFPPGLNEGVFVGFHGQYDEVGLQNEENPLVYADLETGSTIDFISNDDVDAGHFDHLLATDDALFLVDLCGSGSLAEAGPCGVIYEVTAR